jgi:hypothetical protein
MGTCEYVFQIHSIGPTPESSNAFVGTGQHSAFGEVQDLALKMAIKPDETVDVAFSDRETLFEGQLDLDSLQIIGLSYNGTLESGKAGDGESQGPFELEKIGEFLCLCLCLCLLFYLLLVLVLHVW